MPCGKPVRVTFTKEHDLYLIKYLAVYCPTKDGRHGNAVYRRLEANVDNLWPWSARHPWQSWRDRYVKHSAKFDASIRQYQKKHDISGNSLKRPAEQTPIESLGGPSAKRARIELAQEEEESSSETRRRLEAGPSATSPSKPTSKSSQPSSSSAPGPSTRPDDIPFTPFTPTPKSMTRYPRPLSRPRPVAPVSNTRPNGATVVPTTQERAVEAESSTAWPPVRGHTASKRKPSEPVAEAETHHPFSQSQPPPGIDILPKGDQARARQKPFNPFTRGLKSDRRAVAAQFSDKTQQRSTESELGKDVHQNGKHERPHARESAPVPSVDLVAVSSARSLSRSTDVSAPARGPRWSLPAFGHATPWVSNQLGGVPSAPGSTSRTGAVSPFKWAAANPTNGHTPTLAGLSFSPARSLAEVATDPVHTSSPAPGPCSSPDLMPHPTDLALAASHGLAMFLDRMSANHGLPLGVVKAVYKRVGCLREADEVLNGMRKAAESFGQRDIERRRGRRRWRGLRYVLASEDGSEYSPPETSRAALWKRQSESASRSEEDEEGEKEKVDGDGGSGSVGYSEEDGEEKEEDAEVKSGSASHSEKEGEESEREDGKSGSEEEKSGSMTHSEDGEKEKAGGEDERVSDEGRDNEEEEEEEVGRAMEAELKESDDERDGDEPRDTHHDFSQLLPVAGEENAANDIGQQDLREGRLVAALVVNKQAQKVEKELGKSAFRKGVAVLFT